MIRARIAAVCLGTLLGFALVEVALQGAALVARWRGHPNQLVGLTDRRRIVALGDSNTYGIFLEAGEAYPAVVTREWPRRAATATQEGRPEAAPAEIVNLAYPGTSSSVLLARLPEVLRATKPDEVWLMVGVNDYWTAPPSFARTSAGTTDATQEGGPRPAWSDVWSGVHSFLWEHVRTYRMISIAWRSQGVGQLEGRNYDRRALEMVGPAAPADRQARTPSEGVFTVGGERIRLGSLGLPDGVYPGGILAMETLSDRLTEAVEIIRRQGARPVLLTYPYPRGMYEIASAQIREVAREGAVDLVDVGERMQGECPVDPCKELFFDDFHPTARTHQIIAGMILEAGVLDRQRP